MRTLPFLLLAGFATLAHAEDLRVDASGHGDYTTISQAMAVAAPGDRILVEPGHYAAFAFFVGVDVVGLGTAPEAVTIDRIDYHVSIPNQHSHTRISNVKLGSDDPLDAIALSGNELAAGTLHVEGTVIDGAVHLRGTEGFSVVFQNCRLAHGSTETFSGEAMTLGGDGAFVELRDSTVLGADADSSAGACAALRLVDGTQARIIGCTLRGGNGSVDFPTGAAALVVSRKTVPTTLRLDGDSVFVGGDGVQAPGGAGVDLFGSIALGTATVQGGSGQPPGPDYADAQPEFLPVDLHLRAEPRFADAQAPVYLQAGESFRFHLETSGLPSLLLVSLGLGEPPAGRFLSVDLESLLFVRRGPAFEGSVPDDPNLEIVGLTFHVQGLVWIPGLPMQVSDLASMRVDLGPPL